MEYTQKHKKIIATFLRKAGKNREAEIALTCDEYKIEISEAVREASHILGVPIANEKSLLDALRRYENRNCPVFEEYPFPKCEGGVWCDIYNLGGSHSFVGDKFRNLGIYVIDISPKERREIMLKMIKEKTKGKRDITS